VKFQNFKIASVAILDSEIHVFGTALLLQMSARLNWWSLTVLRLAVEKLLRFLFWIGNTL